jgi:hypothetical protein
MSFHIFAPIHVLPWYMNFKKNQIPVPNGNVKNPIPIQHWFQLEKGEANYAQQLKTTLVQKHRPTLNIGQSFMRIFNVLAPLVPSPFVSEAS